MAIRAWKKKEVGRTDLVWRGAKSGEKKINRFCVPCGQSRTRGLTLASTCHADRLTAHQTRVADDVNRLTKVVCLALLFLLSAPHFLIGLLNFATRRLLRGPGSLARSTAKE